MPAPLAAWMIELWWRSEHPLMFDYSHMLVAICLITEMITFSGFHFRFDNFFRVYFNCKKVLEDGQKIAYRLYVRNLSPTNIFVHHWNRCLGSKPPKPSDGL